MQVDCCEHFADAFTVSETLEYWINRDKEKVLDAARHSNGFVVTEREFRALWQFEVRPHTPYRLVAHLLEELGLDILIVTFADRGSQVFDATGTFFVPALEVKTVDSTGAGNAFSGGIVSTDPEAVFAIGGACWMRSRLAPRLRGFQVQDFSNHALRRASAADISELQRQVTNSISWFDAKDEASG